MPAIRWCESSTRYQDQSGADDHRTVDWKFVVVFPADSIPKKYHRLSCNLRTSKTLVALLLTLTKCSMPSVSAIPATEWRDDSRLREGLGVHGRDMATWTADPVDWEDEVHSLLRLPNLSLLRLLNLQDQLLPHWLLMLVDPLLGHGQGEMAILVATASGNDDVVLSAFHRHGGHRSPSAPREDYSERTKGMERDDHRTVDSRNFLGGISGRLDPRKSTIVCSEAFRSRLIPNFSISLSLRIPITARTRDQMNNCSTHYWYAKSATHRSEIHLRRFTIRSWTLCRRPSRRH